MHLAAGSADPDAGSSTAAESKLALVASSSAAVTPRTQLLDFLAQKRGCADLVDARAFNGATPLHWAAGAGHDDAVDWLLRQVEGSHALLSACVCGERKFLKRYL